MDFLDFILRTFLIGFVAALTGILLGTLIAFLSGMPLPHSAVFYLLLLILCSLAAGLVLRITSHGF